MFHRNALMSSRKTTATSLVSPTRRQGTRQKKVPTKLKDATIQEKRKKPSSQSAKVVKKRGRLKKNVDDDDQNDLEDVGPVESVCHPLFLSSTLLRCIL